MSFIPYPRNYRNGSVVIDNAQIGGNSTTLTSHTHFDKSIELNRTYGGYRKYWIGMLGEGNKVNNVPNYDNSFGICVQPEDGSVAEPTVLLELNKDGDLKIKRDAQFNGPITADEYKFTDSSSRIYQNNGNNDIILNPSHRLVLPAGKYMRFGDGGSNPNIGCNSDSDKRLYIQCNGVNGGLDIDPGTNGQVVIHTNNRPPYTLENLHNKGVINFPQTEHDFSSGNYLPYIGWSNATDDGGDGDGIWENICSIGTYKASNGERGSLYFAVNADDTGFINGGVSNVMTLTGGTSNNDRGRLSVPGDIYLQDNSKLLLGTGGNIISNVHGMIAINCAGGIPGDSGLWLNSGKQIQSFVGVSHRFSGTSNQPNADVRVAGDLSVTGTVNFMRSGIDTCVSGMTSGPTAADPFAPPSVATPIWKTISFVTAFSTAVDITKISVVATALNHNVDQDLVAFNIRNVTKSGFDILGNSNNSGPYDGEFSYIATYLP
jgi:hypothetical protein